MATIKGSRAYDILINSDDNIEVKSIKSNQDNIPFAFQKRDKIPMDIVEIKPPIASTSSTPSPSPSPSIEKEKDKDSQNLRKSYSSQSVLSSLSNLPYDERPVPTLYNKMKKEREERAKKSVSLMDKLSEETKAQLSWKKSVDDDLYGNRPKSAVSKCSAYDKQQQRSSMTIIAEVISSGDFNTDSESEYEEESEINVINEVTENNENNKEEDKEEDKEEVKLTIEDNDSLANNINNNSNSNIYPAECIASSIEDIKSNICQVENRSIRNSVVTEEQINKHLSHQSLTTIKKTSDDKNQNVPQLTISLAPEVNCAQSAEEHKLLAYDSKTDLKLNKKETKDLKKEKKPKKSSTTGCHCIIS